MRFLSKTGRRLVLPVLFCLFSAPSCVHRHIVGLGPTGAEQVSVRQYYILFGLLDANDVDAQRMASGLTSYEIVTEYGLVDLVLAPFLFVLTMTSRTVTVRT